MLSFVRRDIGAGFCPCGYGFMVKRIFGTADDQVEMGMKGVHVNGRLLRLSARVASDKAGRSTPPCFFEAYTLNGSEILLMSDVSEASFDSRYFDTVHASQIEGVISPILTW